MEKKYTSKTIKKLSEEELLSIQNNLEAEGLTLSKDFNTFVRNEFLDYLSKQLDPIFKFLFFVPEKFICDCSQLFEREDKNDIVNKTEYDESFDDFDIIDELVSLRNAMVMNNKKGKPFKKEKIERMREKAEPFLDYIQADIEELHSGYMDHIESDEKLSITYTPGEKLKIKYIDNHISNKEGYTNYNFNELEFIAYEMLKRDIKKQDDFTKTLIRTLKDEDPIAAFKHIVNESYSE